MRARREKGQGMLRGAVDVGTRADGWWEPQKGGERGSGHGEWQMRPMWLRPLPPSFPLASGLGLCLWPHPSFTYTPHAD